jgi:osmotically-inducible protein OsmY
MNRKIPVTAFAVLWVGVVGGCGIFQGGQSPSEYADDVALTTKVKADLVDSDKVDALDVNVDVKDGNVTLSGYASTPAEREKATQVARNVTGVKSVDNNMTIKEK